MAKILLVEDEINIASFIERGLQEFGHEVRVANDGQAGWELVQQEDFQLLILDIIMPKMNGLQLCKQYRQTYGYQSPVIMLTALGTTDDIVNGLDAGADDYLVKPFSFQELEARIKPFTAYGGGTCRTASELWRPDTRSVQPPGDPWQGSDRPDRKGIPPARISDPEPGDGTEPADLAEKCLGQELRYEYECGGCLCQLPA